MRDPNAPLTELIYDNDPVPKPPKPNWWKRFLNWLKRIFS